MGILLNENTTISPLRGPIKTEIAISLRHALSGFLGTFPGLWLHPDRKPAGGEPEVAAWLHRGVPP